MNTLKAVPATSAMTLKLGEADRARLKALAAVKKRTTHYLMKEAVERYLRVEEMQQAVLNTVDDAVSHYELTGLHLTQDEVKSWAESLAKNPDAVLAQCHG